MRAGYELRWITTVCRIRTSRIRNCAKGNLRAKYDVIIYPHVGGNSSSHLTGIPKNGADPVPYKKSELTPNLGVLDQSDDIRGGMGIDGLAELVKFVQEGGTLITEGSTTAFLAEYGITPGVMVERPAQLFARGSIMRGVIGDRKSPIAYGFEGRDLPVYFNQEPVLSAGGGFAGSDAAADSAAAPRMWDRT
jgi:hypothetical protein